MTILEMAPYINGDAFTRECKAPIRCTPEMYARVVKEAACNDSFERVLSMIEDYRDFAELMPDIARVFPVSEREEMFYCLKNGGYSPAVPAKCIYILRTLFKEHGSISLALKALSKDALTIFFQKNYLDGCSLRDVIKSMVDPDYEPFTPARLRIQHKDYDEVLVQSKDMVALLPKNLSMRLTEKDLEGIELTKDGLAVNGLLLRIMGEYYGACNSIYDLRRLV